MTNLESDGHADFFEIVHSFRGEMVLKDLLTASIESLTAVDQLRDSSPSAALTVLTGLRKEFPRDSAVVARLGVVGYMLDQDEMAREALEEAVALDPANFLALKFLGAIRMRQGQPVAAIAALRDAPRLDPEESGVHSMLGAFLMQTNQFEEAVPELLQALKLDPADASALNNIAALPWSETSFAKRFPEGHAGMVEKVRGFLLERLRRNQLTRDQALLLVTLRVHNGRDFNDLVGLARVLASGPPVDAQASFNLGAIFALAGDLPTTLECYQKAHALAPGSYRIRNAIGYQQICCGAELFRTGFSIANETWPLINPDAYATDTPGWDGGDLLGQEIFVYQEQGSGDAVLSLRLLPLIAARGGKVVLWTRPELAGLARNAPGVSRFVDAAERPTSMMHKCSVAIPLLGAVSALQAGAKELRIPTVLPAPSHAGSWTTQLLAAKFKVGLCVLGNPLRSDDWTRSVPPDFFPRFAQFSDVQWVNLSVDHRAEQQLLRKALPDMLDVTHELRSFAETAALIAGLDAVVSIDSVNAHIAASLGKPVLLLAPPTLDWRWQIADDLHPWWPSVEVLRAATPQAFGASIDRAMTRLAEMATRKRLS
jgi:Flp pilus assembly protein TadD